MDPSTAAAWRDLYIGMVGAGASLTGLTFVAIALDPHQIERTPLLRLRAASALWCFVSVMFIGLAVLTPTPTATDATVVKGLGVRTASPMNMTLTKHHSALAARKRSSGVRSIW